MKRFIPALFIIALAILGILVLSACNRSSSADTPQFYTAESVDDLLHWIRTANIRRDPRSLFLETAREAGSIITVSSSEYELEAIRVWPDYDSKQYAFTSGSDNIINVAISPTGIDPANPNRPLDKNQIHSLVGLYEDFPDIQINETRAAINGQETTIYYINGGDFFPTNLGETRFVGTRAFFEIK
jgi:hypothetical protein